MFYNIAGGIEHQIRREKRTTISEVSVRVKQNIKSLMQNRNWFYFEFSVESSSFIFSSFKTETFKLTFEGWNRPVCHLFGFTRVSPSVKICCISHSKRIVMALMPSLLFRCFSLFLPHLRTLAIGHYRNVRGLGKSIVVFRLFEKLRYSNERLTIF